MTLTSFYLGRPGKLVALPHPTEAPDVPLEFVSEARRTIGGGQIVDRTPVGMRTWNLTWSGVSFADWCALRAFHAGHNGPGPWAFLDPQEINLLTVNQSSATTGEGDASGFTASEGSAVTWSEFGSRSDRVLSWQMAGASELHTLTLDAPHDSWLGIPVVPGKSYRFQFSASTEHLTASLTPRLAWSGIYGSPVSTSSGSAVAISDGAWSDCYVSATAPAGAVWVTPTVSASAAIIGGVGAGGPGTVSVTSPPAIVLDELMLSMPTTEDPRTTWAPGLGVAMVSWTEAPTSYPRGGVWDVSGTLIEIG